LVSQFQAFPDCLTIYIGIEKELCLTDHSVRTAKAMQQCIQVYDLPDSIRWTRLLTVAESGISDVEIWRWIEFLRDSVEHNFGHGIIGKDVPEQVRFRDVLEFITTDRPGLLFQPSLVGVPYCHESPPV
jgi:hypothetical protein